jgi:uncharacterized protein YdcH (DUF465 family)
MGTIEKMMSHYETLKDRHDILDKKINAEYSHHIDNHILTVMKKQKLHLKDEMYRIESELKR